MTAPLDPTAPRAPRGGEDAQLREVQAARAADDTTARLIGAYWNAIHDALRAPAGCCAGTTCRAHERVTAAELAILQRVASVGEDLRAAAAQRDADLAEDSRLLDALERYAVENCSMGSSRDLGDVEIYDECDCTEPCDCPGQQFTVIGPPARWGNYNGEGVRLRDAIRRAIAMESEPDAWATISARINAAHAAERDTPPSASPTTTGGDHAP